MTQSHAEFLRTIDAHPFSVNGHVVQPHRLYFELTEADVRRFRIIADAHEALVEAVRAALAHVTELRDAWMRGAIDERDGKGGLRSNRNVDVEVAARAALKLAEQSGEKRA